MAASPNPIATEHLPFFITAPGETDVLYIITLVFVVAMVVLFFVVFLTINTLPMRIANKRKKIQFDIVAVLCLLALLSLEDAFWIAALLVAYIDFPDLVTPFKRIAGATEKIAGQKPNVAPLAHHSEPEPPKVVPADQPPKGKKGAVHA